MMMQRAWHDARDEARQAVRMTRFRMLWRLLAWGIAGAPLTGCGEKPYAKKDGAWQYDGNLAEIRHPESLQALGAKGAPTSVFARDAEVAYYRGSVIEGSDGPSFTALDAHYAHDKARAYWCDTYRKGQEYYTVKHNDIVVLDSVALASFRLLTGGYARDSTRVFFEGRHVRVRDLATFEILEDGYQRDAVTAYYERTPIAGSDGRTFVVLSQGYSHDARTVFFTHYRSQDTDQLGRTVVVKGAAPATFTVKEASYAVDAAHVYHNGVRISSDVAGFAVLGSVYAKAGGTVFYDGTPIAGADAATFTVMDRQDDGADARDARRRYRRGEPQ